jgi:hypothetical protein
MKTINDVRKQLKKIGFKLKTKNFSFGRIASYENTFGDSMPTIFTKETLEEWQPLIDWRKEHREELQAIGKSEGIISLA